MENDNLKSKAIEAIESLSDADKAELVAGATFWSTQEIQGDGSAPLIPSITLTDGPNGVRKQPGSFDNLGLSESLPATCFPCACTSACTWDPNLIEIMGRAIGEECRKENVAVDLGPGINIKRHPLGGRNFEYFSEDPLISGKMGAAYTKGVQSVGVGACLKHFAANNQETARMTSDSVIDERTLNDIYLRGFEIAVREAQPATVMTAYNRLNGTYCSENVKLLGKLRQEWGFNGALVSDWGAMSKSVPSVTAGLDLCMPGPRPDHSKAVAKGLSDRTLSHASLNRAAERVAELALRYSNPAEAFDCDYAEHLAIAQLVAENGAVLMKNEGMLPVDPSQKIAVIGAFAKTPRYQGSGSSKINPVNLDCALQAFEDANMNVAYAKGYDPITGNTSGALVDEAAAAAAAADAVIVFAGLPDSYESEGFDRKNLDMPDGMNRVITEVAACCGNVAVVLSGGGPIAMPWLDKVQAVLALQLAGCQSGHAAVNLLLGQANPSGKLCETWPASLEDTALGSGFPMHGKQIRYIEGPFVGYRYYDASGVTPAFPFGHGLSYTSFEYSNMKIEAVDGGFDVSCDITNAGNRDGAEIVQVYIAPIDPAVPLPPQSLAGFAKQFIAAGGTSTMRLHVECDAFAYWDTEAHSRRIDEGSYEVRISASSTDIRLRQTLTLDEHAPFEVSPKADVGSEDKDRLAPYYHVKPHGFTDESFLALYGEPLPPIPPTRPFTPDSPMSDLNLTPFGRFMLALTRRHEIFHDGDPEMQKMLDAMFDEMPLRSIVMGGLSYTFVLAVCAALNKKPMKGIYYLLVMAEETLEKKLRR